MTLTSEQREYLTIVSNSMDSDNWLTRKRMINRILSAGSYNSIDAHILNGDMESISQGTKYEINNKK